MARQFHFPGSVRRNRADYDVPIRDNTPLGIVSLAAGVLGVGLILAPNMLSFLGAALALLAIVLGIVSMAKGGPGSGLGMTGVVCGWLAFMIPMALFLLGDTTVAARYR